MFASYTGIMDLNKSDLKRYGVLFFGLLMAAGFTFGGMASMSSMVQSPSGNSDSEGQLEDAELPQSQYNENGFDLSDNEKLYLASTESKVFITGYYNNESQKEMLSDLQQLQNTFGDAVYIELTDSDSGRILDQAGISDYPAIIVNGGVTQQGGMRIQSTENVSEVDVNSITETVCRVIPTYPNDATKTTCV